MGNSPSSAVRESQARPARASPAHATSNSGPSASPRQNLASSNAPSRSHSLAGTTSTPSPATTTHHAPAHSHQLSLPALLPNAALGVLSPAQPSPSLESASAVPARQSTSSATDVLRSHTVGLPATSNPPHLPSLLPTSSSTQSPNHLPPQNTMGQGDSKQKGAADPAKIPPPTPSAPSAPATASKPVSKKSMDGPPMAPKQDDTASAPVPFARKGDPLYSPTLSVPADEPDSYMVAASQYSRPPRLPLPIGDIDVDPGSPIISATDLKDDDELNIEGDFNPLLSRASILSSTTVDEDDDIGDDVDTVRGGVLPPVPTTIEWREKGSKVYVTGTFAEWDRKFRLHKREDGVLSTTIYLQPGTHHVKFIVDGDMVLSKHLPTAVDFTNSLVNYIEVAPRSPAEGAADNFVPQVPDLVPTPSPQTLPQDVPAPGTQPMDIAPAKPSPPPMSALTQALHEQPVPPTPSLAPVSGPSSVPPEPKSVSVSGPGLPKVPVPPPVRYHKTIPRFLVDTDADESTPEFNRALDLSVNLPVPPSLPLFLSKSILNMATPMKDDASVLVNPNHTVLNHLATSSIKGGVIATSATTRYKRKFLTSIMYKPTHPDD